MKHVEEGISNSASSIARTARRRGSAWKLVAALAVLALSTVSFKRYQGPGNTAPRELAWQGCIDEVNPGTRLAHLHTGSVEERLITKPYFRNGILIPWPSGGTPSSPGYEGLDLQKYQNILDGVTPLGGCSHGGAIPPNYSGVMVLDVEANWWDPFRQLQSFTDEDAQAVFDDVYMPLIQATLALRPNATVSLYQMVFFDPDASPYRWNLIQQMYAPLDRIDQSCYRHGTHSFASDANIVGARLGYAFELSALQNNKPVRAWIWHFYHGNGAHGSGLVPMPEIRDWIDLWSAYDIVGFTHLGGDGDANSTVNDAIINLIYQSRLSLDETPITLP